MKIPLILASFLVSVSTACQQQPAQLSTAQRVAIADSVRQLFADLAAATSAVQLDSLLTLYEHSDDFKFAAYGAVVRPYSAFADTVRSHFRGLVRVSFVPETVFVDVWSRDVAVATAPFRFTGQTNSGQTASACGVYTAVYGRRPPTWKIIYAGSSTRAGCD